MDLAQTPQTSGNEAFQVKNSKRNLAARQQQLKERLDRSWQPQREDPVLESGNIHYEVSGRVKAVDCGGLGMLQAVVSATGLREAIDDEVAVLKRHLPYHESDHILSLAYTLLTGGSCLGDLQERRENVAFLDALGARRIPDPTTAGDFLRRFDDEQKVLNLMQAINRARSSVWQTRPTAERQLARIDVDGSIVETTGWCKERMDMAYNGRWGFGPLFVSLANSDELLYAVNRPASRPSHDGAVVWIDRAITWAQRGAGFEQVRLRGDTDFSLTEHFDRWTRKGVEFVFGIDAHPSFVRRAKALEVKAWKPFERPSRQRASRRRRAPNVRREVVVQKGYRNLTLEQEHVAEMDYRPRKSQKTYRMIVLRKRIRVTEGQLRLDDDILYFFYVTNVSKSRLSTADVVHENNARCQQENVIEQLKNGVQATRLPVREFYANWTYLVIAALAWNIKAWAGLLLPEEMGARALLRMEFRRFLSEIVRLPAQILTSGRRLVFRLLEVNRWTTLLLEGTQRLKRWQYG